ncbi:HAMP domain-containing sensor histidine kinase [Thermoflavimicrobium dichotomicum]|uniref:Sensor histidine kinase n=1 Tax=Thermoflavimicrobium dichotomicum TaxID=46223 RepID=A0A1I3TZJ2_9BACL|nr:sensor histidine kinase [Thermoflavimicrobium dichotomicum]SFJ76718.1 two-component system, NarL family, sensor histidine kinase LiaS [Thermoflavimicrobium dichotomicum]
MKKKGLNIQWKIMLFSVAVSLFSSLLIVFLISVHFQLKLSVLMSVEFLNIPLIFPLLVYTLWFGTWFGYYYGKRLKKRLERLDEAILKFEGGHFSYRVPPLEEDEIGLIGQSLNRMAERIEKQVFSLQKLATEKAVFEERQRLARELHDAVSQQLFAISMVTAALLEQNNAVPAALTDQVALIEKMARNALGEMRALLLHLRPVTLEGRSLPEALTELLADFQAKHPIHVEWEIDESIQRLPKGIEDHLFRIAQEGLANVLRHSQATSVTVKLLHANKQIMLKIIDNGIGFDTSKMKTSTVGLSSIQERATEIGGVGEIFSLPGKGTQIVVKVPIIEREWVE